MTVLKKSCALALVLSSLLAFTNCASHHHGYRTYSRGRVVYVETSPPEPVVEVVSVSPGAGYCWIPGRYRWDGRSYVWLSGRWQLAPRGRTVWISGRWERHPRGWFWVEGRWS
jgi:hypothetical protein